MTGSRCRRVIASVVTRLTPADWRESIAGDLAEERLRRLARGQREGAVWYAAAGVRIAARLRLTRWRDRQRPIAAADVPRAVMAGLSGDLRQAVRGLRHAPGYTAAAMATIALGLGANVAVFNLTDWLLLRPLPGVARQRQLVTITFGTTSGFVGPVSMPALDQLAASVPALSGLAGFSDAAVNLALPDGVARHLDAEIVTGNFFDVLGRPLEAGRGFSADEGRIPSLPPAAVISDRIWREELGASPRAIDAPLLINGERWTIIGVASRGFRGPSRSAAADVWVPIAQHRRVLPQYSPTLLTNPAARVIMGMIGRLSPGATPAIVDAEAETVRARQARDQPKDFQLTHWRFMTREGVESQAWVREKMTHSLSLLFGVVGVLLILTCANVGNVMIARVAGRRAEIATRLALGASRRRVARLLLTESLLLSLGAGALALVVAWLVGHALAGTTLVQGVRPLDRPELDWQVFGFALFASATVAIVAGALPALSVARVDINAALRSAGRTATVGRNPVRQLLTVTQVAASLTLLVGALLLARSMTQRRSIDPGFDPSKALEFSVSPQLQGYDTARQLMFGRTLLANVRALPGVRSAGFVWSAPYSMMMSDTNVRAFGDGGPTVSAVSDSVSNGYFEALGLRMLQGRDFADAELAQPDHAVDHPVVVSRSLALALFANRPAAGQRLALSDRTTLRVIGVVSDLRQAFLLEPAPPLIFFPTQYTETMVVGLNAPAADGETAIRRVVHDLDPALPIYDAHTLAAPIAAQLADDALVARLTTIFALLATVLAMVGVYGMLASGVTERRREFGIRAALGARPATVARLVTREALKVAVAGVAIGGVAALWLSRFIANRLYGVTRFDPWSFASAVALILTATALSTWAPARRAAQLNVVDELRQ